MPVLRPGCAQRGGDRVPGAGCWAGWWCRCSVLVPASDSEVITTATTAASDSEGRLQQ